MIQEAKVAAYADIPAFLELCFLGRGAGEKTRKKRQRSSPPPAFLRELMERVAGMRFDEEPDYEVRIITIIIWYSRVELQSSILKKFTSSRFTIIEIPQ